VYAPYVDVMLYPTPSVSAMQAKTGQKYYTLAFITSGNGNNPAWGGVTPLSDNFYLDEINKLRSQGGDVILSFGGANGTELALSNTDVATLQAKYQSVIDKYKLTWVDFDIEGWAVAENASIDRRNKAIKGLQAANPGLTVAFCLPVLPQGLTQDGIYVLQNAKDNGVRIDVVNVMAMDFGDGVAPNPSGQMGKYVIDSVKNTRAQIQGLGINTRMGVTPMIGRNDVATEVFTLDDARQVLTWSQTNDVRLIAMWSTGRDNGTCPNSPWASATCSGLAQPEYAFIDAFKSF